MEPETEVIEIEDEVFVFGSNELGIHGGGAARVARNQHGAVLHQGFGPQGNSFGIPTCSKPTGEPNHEISLKKLDFYIRCFILWATMTPEKRFKVSQVGCGLAGWTAEEVAPLFINAPDNCSFDTDWKPFLGNRKYWGHV